MTFIAPQAKLFAHLDLLADLRATGRTAAPINVEIDLSNRCSLGCEWCHFAYTHTRGPLAGKREKPAGAVAGGDLMSEVLAERILADFAEAGVRSITWTGGGEPTLHPAFNELAEYAAGLGLAQGVYTHGGHIDAKRAALLKRHMTFVYVSLDAADAASYKAAKGVDRFAKVCDNLRLLVAADGDATVGVGYLVTESNWASAHDAAATAADVGADYIQFRPTITYGQEDPGAPVEDRGWLDDALSHLAAVAERFANVEVDMDRFRMYRDWQGHGYPTCWWSMLQTCVTPNGKVWACVNKREHAAAEIGDLSVESFAEVWARHSVEAVGADCRLMCRGHLPNLTLDTVMADVAHPEFV